MAKILYAWELGGGLGHLTRIYPILMALQQRGHQVSAAIREQSHAETIWPGLQLPVHRAPHKTQPAAYEVHPVKYYCDILNNIGWGDSEELQSLLFGWQDIYRQERPNFVIHDHSPTALLISQALEIPHALLGTGFCAPPDESPSRLMRTWEQAALAKEQKISSEIVAKLNHFFPQKKQQLTRPSEIYSRVSENFLTTFAELDHFGARDGAKYWGIPNATAGIRPTWPEGKGPKLFAYLHADARKPEILPGILQAIEKLKIPTLVYINGKPKEPLELQPATMLRIVSEPVDLAWAAEQCAAGILNGSHGATAAFLLAGRPILQLPIHLEQYLGAKRSVELGAALIVDRCQPDSIALALRRLLNEQYFALKAREFRERYRKWTPEAQTNAIVARIEELIK